MWPIDRLTLASTCIEAMPIAHYFTENNKPKDFHDFAVFLYKDNSDNTCNKVHRKIEQCE